LHLKTQEPVQLKTLHVTLFYSPYSRIQASNLLFLRLFYLITNRYFLLPLNLETKGGALSNLIYCELSLPTAGGLDWVMFKDLF